MPDPIKFNGVIECDGLVIKNDTGAELRIFKSNHSLAVWLGNSVGMIGLCSQAPGQPPYFQANRPNQPPSLCIFVDKDGKPMIQVADGEQFDVTCALYRIRDLVKLIRPIGPTPDPQ